MNKENDNDHDSRKDLQFALGWLSINAGRSASPEATRSLQALKAYAEIQNETERRESAKHAARRASLYISVRGTKHGTVMVRRSVAESIHLAIRTGATIRFPTANGTVCIDSDGNVSCTRARTVGLSGGRFRPYWIDHPDTSDS